MEQLETVTSFFCFTHFVDLKEGEAIASLYRQIGACDVVLEQLESLLTSFQTGLRK